jgi:hypothetical protein
MRAMEVEIEMEESRGGGGREAAVERRRKRLQREVEGEE